MNQSIYVGGNEEQELILLRGAPGSGKSTLADKLKEKFGYSVRENDNFFLDKDGNYKFKLKFHNFAKEVCLKDTYEDIFRGMSVVVSNTFTKLDELDPYIEIANRHNIKLNIIEMKLSYDNIHNVPNDIVRSKIESFESFSGAQEVISRDYDFVVISNFKHNNKSRLRM